MAPRINSNNQLATCLVRERPNRTGSKTAKKKRKEMKKVPSYKELKLHTVGKCLTCWFPWDSLFSYAAVSSQQLSTLAVAMGREANF